MSLPELPKHQKEPLLTPIFLNLHSILKKAGEW